MALKHGVPQVRLHLNPEWGATPAVLHSPGKCMWVWCVSCLEAPDPSRAAQLAYADRQTVTAHPAAGFYLSECTVLHLPLRGQCRVPVCCGLGGKRHP